MTVKYSDIVFAYDFDRLTADGRLFDYGPHGLHATPGAGAAAPTRQLDGSYYFDGGDYFYLAAAPMARFYSVAPTGAHTWLFATKMLSVTATAHRIFSCETAVAGLAIIVVATASPTVSWRISGTGAGLRQYNTSAASVPLESCQFAGTYESTPRTLVSQAVVGGAWAAGAYGTTVYDAATVPRIGTQPTGGGAVVGRIYYLALLSGAVSSPDLAALSNLMRDGGKPFCWR